MKKKSKIKRILGNILLFFLSMGLLASGVLLIWLASIKIPDFKSYQDRKVAESTKIYDRTGQIMLYDLSQDIKRTNIPSADMGTYIKNATVAIEDSNFYSNNGIELPSILRATFVDLLHGHLSQGGSTITQQIIKNTLLTSDKTITRKLKEWILSIKISREMSKADILEAYLNDAPYGGNIYGVEEAAETYFGKKPADMTLAEASYLASIPNAPTFYSPYGPNRDKLDARAALVLSRMHDLHFITDEEYNDAKNEKVVFAPQDTTGIKAPHFVFYVKDYLENKYGADMVDSGGLKVITTLDMNLQTKAEDILKKDAPINQKTYNASNAGLVAIDPKTGQILAMVGSRDYFDKTIDGNYNIATASRQPGSAFKPFVYAASFEKGYTPDTVLFDLPTEFNTGCSIYGKAMGNTPQTSCYMPQDYTGSYSGPMTVRKALAGSINVPAVKMLYLVGIDTAIKKAREMGITTLNNDPSTYGLTLVLGGGEVKLVDMTSAYGVFATEGIRHPDTSILKVLDKDGNTLEEFNDQPQQVLDKNAALQISDILSDNSARTWIFGPKSSLYFPDHDVAVKTGTTNDFKDAWTVGYTPSLVVGTWVGNNDNTPMKAYASAILSTPMWHEFMNYALQNTPNEPFEKPQPEDTTALKPVLKGYWQGGESFMIDTVSGKLATDSTPKETLEEKVITDVHDILYWVNKDDPRGPAPANPYDDPEFTHWEIPVQNWWATHQGMYPLVTVASKPTETDDVHIPANQPTIAITSPNSTDHYDGTQQVSVTVTASGAYAIKKVDFFLNDNYIGSSSNYPFSFSFIPDNLANVNEKNELRAVAYDTVYNSNSVTSDLWVSK